MTATDLLTKLSSIGITFAIDGDELLIDGDLPAEAEPAIDLLRAPLIALLTGRKLFAFLTGGKPFNGDGILSPADLLPADVRMLAAEGGEWDRISPFARDAMPDLFAAVPTKRKAARR